MIDKKIARESQVTMRTRRPLDGQIKEIMERISDGLLRVGRPALTESQLRMVAVRRIQLARAR